MNIWESLGFKNCPYSTNPLKPCNEDVELLVGRDKEKIELCTVIESDPQGVYIISGQPGVGKTSFFNITQYLLESSQLKIGRHLMCARDLCPIHPSDGSREIAQRAVSTLVKSIEVYCAISQRPIPVEIEKISKWINDKGSTGITVGINFIKFGGSFGKNINLPNFSQTSFERIQDVLSIIVSELMEKLGFDGAFIVLDNIENLDDQIIMEHLLTFRDTLFTAPNIWWIIIGQSGLGSLVQTMEPRVFDRISGVGLELKPITRHELYEAVEKRVERFHITKEGKSPITREVHNHLFDASNGEIRSVFKYSNNICIRVVSRVRQKVKETFGEVNEKEVDVAMGRLLIEKQIPNPIADPILKNIIGEELSGLNLKSKEKEVLRLIGERGSARASYYKDFGVKTKQDFSGNYLSKFYRMNLLLRSQEGRSVVYRLRGLAELASEFGLLGKKA